MTHGDRHVDHLAFVLQCVIDDVPVPLCLDCYEIVETMTVAGDPIKLETDD
jgi:hypothetical protein